MSDALLAGQANPDGTACLWAVDGPQRIVLIWPTGYTAGGKLLTVFDAEGNKVAVVGRHFSIGGGMTIQDGLNTRTETEAKVLGCENVRQGFEAGPLRPIK